MFIWYLYESLSKFFKSKLLNAEEWVSGECKGTLGELLIRCNNVLYIRLAPDNWHKFTLLIYKSFNF